MVPPYLCPAIRHVELYFNEEPFLTYLLNNVGVLAQVSIERVCPCPNWPMADSYYRRFRRKLRLCQEVTYAYLLFSIQSLFPFSFII